MRIVGGGGIDLHEAGVEGGEIGAARGRGGGGRLGGDVVLDWGFGGGEER